MQPNQSKYIAALYMRLSDEDKDKQNKEDDSESIKNQRKMLLSYAKENGFIVYDEYIDDGWSGTNFERPNFKRMIEDIEKKQINLVITKDLSRLGRDYITAGQYTEIYFPSKSVRYIAINDGYDSESPYTDIAPFKNVINEMYARDTSKKIRTAFIAKMTEGDYIGNFAPYGYEKDPENKNHLIIDRNISYVVEHIFQMAFDGYKPTEIVKSLKNRNFPTPAIYRCQKFNLNIDNYSKRKEWTTSTVSKILRNVVYIGNMAQKKTTKVSFKTKITIQNNRKDWIVVENTHEPIISKEVFDVVRRRFQSRTNEKNNGFVNIFSGIAKCADCGKNMSTTGTRKKGSPANLSCGAYKLYGSSECTNHFIDYNVFYDIVLKAIQEQINLSETEKNAMAVELNQNVNNDNSTLRANKETDILNARNVELDKMIEKLYEDNFQGVINDDRFRKLLSKYEAESKMINDKLDFLSGKLSDRDISINPQESYKKFLGLINSCANVETLSTDLLYKLIDRIEIGQGYFEKAEHRKIKRQAIKIYFRFIGNANIKEYVA